MNLFDSHVEWAEGVARMVYSRLPEDVRAHNDFDLVKQNALLGLWDAEKRYRPEFGTTFKTFAAHRIKGAIKDPIRFASRKGTKRIPHDKLSTINEVVGVPANVAAVGSSVDDYEATEQILSLIPFPVRREMFKLYYLDGWTMEELGKKFGFSKSQAIKMLSSARYYIRNNIIKNQMTRPQMCRVVLLFVSQAEKPIFNRELVKKTGFSPGQVSEALKYLKKTSQIRPFREGTRGVNSGGWLINPAS